MVSNIVIDETAESDAGYNGLQCAANRMTRQANAVKLLSNLEEIGIGLNQVEVDGWKRSNERKGKKGIERKEEKFKERNKEERDVGYIRGIMNLRKRQAKEDWEKSRKEYRKEKEKLMSQAKSEKEKNQMKRIIKKVAKETQTVFERTSARHENKAKNLEKKHGVEEVISGGRKYSTWLERIAEGREEEEEDLQEVPNYGGAPLDEDETAALRLHPKFSTFNKVCMENIKFEGTLAHTKTRWSRKRTGSPEEMEEEEELEGEKEEQTDAQVIMENCSREIYDPEQRIIDFCRQKATDMLDNPRVRLPPPRPEGE